MTEPLRTRPSKSTIGDDPDGGQVINPDGSSPEDPIARGMYRGCLIMLLVIGGLIALGIAIYRLAFMNTEGVLPEPAGLQRAVPAVVVWSASSGCEAFFAPR